MPLLVPGSLGDNEEGWYVHGYPRGNGLYSLAIMKKEHLAFKWAFATPSEAHYTTSVGKLKLCLHFRLYPEVSDFVITRITQQSPEDLDVGFMGRIPGRVEDDRHSLMKLGRRIIKSYYRLFRGL